MIKWGIIFFLGILPKLLHAQNFYNTSGFSGYKFSINQSFPTPFSKHKDSISLTKKNHSPTKATLMSTLLPGLGQAYNKKYWKIPIIVAGLGGTAWFVNKNGKIMHSMQDELTIRLDNDSTTIPSNEYAGISNEQLTADRNYYRANRDYGIIAFVAIYVLNIVDAAVDANFYNFNIDKPLAQQKTKHWNIISPTVQNKPTIGIAFKF